MKQSGTVLELLLLFRAQDNNEFVCLFRLFSVYPMYKCSIHPQQNILRASFQHSPECNTQSETCKYKLTIY
jgi:hypothetical protein